MGTELERSRGDIVITGASRGIGRATALYLAERGYRVFAGVRRESDAASLRAAAAAIVPITVDVRDQHAVDTAVAQVRETTDQLRAVVNNAGLPVPAPLEAMPIEDFEWQLDVNLTGALRVTQAFLPLIRSGGGRIVNISSVNGRVATRFNGAYCVSKFGLEALSDSLRLELRRWKIPVILVEPGAIDTPIWETTQVRAAEVADRVSGPAATLYAGVFRRTREWRGAPPRWAIPATRVARVIHRAIRARRPSTRYVVGLDARVAILLKWLLPDRVMDRILAR